MGFTEENPSTTNPHICCFLTEPVWNGRTFSSKWVWLEWFGLDSIPESLSFTLFATGRVDKGLNGQAAAACKSPHGSFILFLCVCLCSRVCFSLPFTLTQREIKRLLLLHLWLPLHGHSASGDHTASTIELYVCQTLFIYNGRVNDSSNNKNKNTPVRPFRSLMHTNKYSEPQMATGTYTLLAFIADSGPPLVGREMGRRRGDKTTCSSIICFTF